MAQNIIVMPFCATPVTTEPQQRSGHRLTEKLPQTNEHEDYLLTSSSCPNEKKKNSKKDSKKESIKK
jgi:hypothetical protein